MHDSHSTPRELAFDVNQHRLLGEVGLFFSSATAAFAECVQNAYRAQATTLRVTADPLSRTVVFRDNGIGLTDPVKFLTVAESGWDTERVKHAAGLGSLALFAIATEVEIISMPKNGSAPWRMRFTDAALRNEAPVECWDSTSPALWTEHGDEPHGVEIRATLRESATFPKLDADGSESWRHRFPLAITIESPNAKAEDGVTRVKYTVEEYTGYAIQTRVGTLYVAPRSEAFRRVSGSYNSHIAVEWEHRQTGTVSLEDDVLTAETCAGITKTVRDDVIERLRRAVSLVWVVSPDANVEAKLPDRETLVRDEGFGDAMRVLADALLAEFNVEEVRDAFAELADGNAIVNAFAIEQKARASRAPFRLRFGTLDLASFTVEPFLAMAGYYHVTGGNDLSNVECSLTRDYEGTEFDVEYEASRAMARPVYVTPFAEIAVAAGVPAISPRNGSIPTGIIPLNIAFGEILHVESLRAVFARDLHFVEPNGKRIAALPLPVFETGDDTLAECDAELEELLPRKGDPVVALFGLPDGPPDNSQSLSDAVMGYIQDSEEFRNYVTIMAGDHRGGDFQLDLSDYEESEGDSWDEVRLMADARRLVAEAAGGEHVLAAERAAILAELDDMLTVPLVLYDRAEKLAKRAAAAEIDPKLTKKILSARRSLKDALAAVHAQQKEVRKLRAMS
ncbi:MAG: hypothetical protein ACR2M1_15145 [Gemmatimonadaceae bacterium]